MKHKIWSVSDLYRFFSEQQNTMTGVSGPMQSATSTVQPVLKLQIHQDPVTTLLLTPVSYLWPTKLNFQRKGIKYSNRILWRLLRIPQKRSHSLRSHLQLGASYKLHKFGLRHTKSAKILCSTAIRCNNSLNCPLSKSSTLPHIKPKIKELKNMNLKHNERQFVFCRHREGRSLRFSLDNPKFDPIPRYSEIVTFIWWSKQAWGPGGLGDLLARQDSSPFRSHHFLGNLQAAGCRNTI